MKASNDFTYEVGHCWSIPHGGAGGVDMFFNNADLCRGSGSDFSNSPPDAPPIFSEQSGLGREKPRLGSSTLAAFSRCRPGPPRDLQSSTHSSISCSGGRSRMPKRPCCSTERASTLSCPLSRNRSFLPGARLEVVQAAVTCVQHKAPAPESGAKMIKGTTPATTTPRISFPSSSIARPWSSSRQRSRSSTVASST